VKILIAMMSHETNTFSPVPTGLERFGSGEAPPEGLSAYQATRGRGSTAAALRAGTPPCPSTWFYWITCELKIQMFCQPG